MLKFAPYFLLILGSLAHAEISWFSGAQKADVTGEVLDAGDILVQSYQLAYSGKEGPWTVESTIGYSHYDLTYVPVLSGNTQQLEEGTFQTNVGVTYQWNSSFSGTLNIAAYDGFAEYRSIWISEYYRQQFIGFPEEYYAPDPHGESIGASFRWDYLPGAGSATFNLGLSRDEVAPGWSFNSATAVPEPDREELYTFSGGARAEQAINGWLKTEVDVTARKTSDRDGRYGIKNTWAAAAGPVTFRVAGGFSYEAPAFDAIYGTAIVDWKFHPQWSVHLGYRAYSDSGEVQTSGFNATAPAVDSAEIFTGVLWDRGDLSISGGIGYLTSDYEALNEDNTFFGNLYRDRDWKTFRLAASYRF
ncbi:MAG: hypothetical protein HC845_03820 [Akkermansiaceae bacterium]|nr:hypothetical protein [Akkermansiaceae bacterium]